MPPMATERIRRAVERRGFTLRRVLTTERIAAGQTDLDPAFADVHALCHAHTMTSVERMHALWEAVRYVHQRRIEGDVVECGVWRGGSSMLAALTLMRLGDTSRRLYLYDTFSGMSEPTERDYNLLERVPMTRVWDSIRGDRDAPVMAYASLDEVKANMARTEYPPDRVVYVEGRVEDTVPATVPDRVAILRLDTDWYESTRHELEHFWPLVAPGGVLFIDDYGHWAGARDAVDEFFAARPDAPLLVRVDTTGRIAVKA
jgi:O-methyltransferase